MRSDAKKVEEEKGAATEVQEGTEDALAQTEIKPGKVANQN